MGWARFKRTWNWDVPGKNGRATLTFKEGGEYRLTRDQYQSAMSAGAIVSIPNPRSSETEEDKDAGRTATGAGDLPAPEPSERRDGGHKRRVGGFGRRKRDRSANPSGEAD